MKTQKRLGEINVKVIMSEQVQTLMVNDTIKDALTLMMDHRLTTVPVVDSHNRCVGIISRSDLTELFLKEDGELARMLDDFVTPERLFRSLETCDVRQVSELMVYDVNTISEQRNLIEACQQMAKHRIHHIPVVNEKGELAGIVSAFDIVKAVAEHDKTD